MLSSEEFVDLVEKLRARGAVEVSASGYSVKFGRVYEAEPVEMKPETSAKPQDVDIEYWSSS